MQYRQGDILIESTVIPEGAKRIMVERVILAEGEATGHTHEIADPKLVDVLELDSTRYYHLKGASSVKHQEHDVFTIPVDDYIVTPQREYHPKGIVRVKD